MTYDGDVAPGTLGDETEGVDAVAAKAYVKFTTPSGTVGATVDGTAITVVVPTASPGSIAFGLPALGPGRNVTVPAGDILAITYGVTPYAPARAADNATSSSIVYTLGAHFRTSEGSDTFATTTTLTASSV
jgi:hypothetical protein